MRRSSETTPMIGVRSSKTPAPHNKACLLRFCRATVCCPGYKAFAEVTPHTSIQAGNLDDTSPSFIQPNWYTLLYKENKNRTLLYKKEKENKTLGFSNGQKLRPAIRRSVKDGLQS
jgi:hypothetical protein